MLQLILSEALRTNRLDGFIAQEEPRGVAPADLKKFDKLAARLIK
jgi:hypothetical protein